MAPPSEIRTTPACAAGSIPQLGEAAGASSITRSRRLLIPREHGAWGLVLLPFFVGAVVAGNWFQWRTMAAAVAVLSVFLLKEPLLLLLRSRSRSLPEDQRESAKFSLLVCGAAAAIAGIALLAVLPFLPLLVMGGNALVLVVLAVFLILRNYQRHPAFQILNVIGLTSSSLLAYLAARGQLEEAAFWVWGLSAGQGSAAVLVVRARLESIVAHRRSDSTAGCGTFHRWALQAQVVLWGMLALLAANGHPWFLLPFFPPSLLHSWELWQLRSGKGFDMPLRHVGFLQLSASILFSFLLIVVLR